MQDNCFGFTLGEQQILRRSSEHTVLVHWNDVMSTKQTFPCKSDSTIKI